MSARQSGLGFNAFVALSNAWIRPLLVVLYLALLLITQAHAASVPVGFADRQVAGGITSPTSMTVLPDGRVLVVQQNGEIKIIKGDTLLSSNFYTVQNVDSYAERGCLGITHDPNVASNRFIYIYCTVTANNTSFNRLMRVTAAGDVAMPGSEVVLLDLPPVPAGVRWHMGGALRFGPDGKLYIAVGNQEDEWKPVEISTSQDLSNPFGKVLRINSDGSVPSDNPFYNTPGAYRAIFNYGLRNPFSFDIQPRTGLMHINDVGAGSWEEINRGAAGANFGWPAAEGSSNNGSFTNAIHQYSHDVGCAITGGAFYNPLNVQFPATYVGKYFFADFCQGWIRLIDPANPGIATGFATGIVNPVNLGIAPDGSLYYLARNQGAGTENGAVGTVSKISFTNSLAPRFTRHPQSQTILVGSPVTFTVAADDVGSFQWQRNGVDIPGATGTSYTIATTQMSDNQAAFTAVARNASGDAVSSMATLTVTTNRAPTATINAPAQTFEFAAGDVIRYSGTGTDPEDGALPAIAYTWQVDFLHDIHSHPFLPAASGVTGGSFALSNFEEDAANTWLRLSLTVKDSAGLTHNVARDIYPRQQISEMTPVGMPVNGKGPIEKNKSNGDIAAGDGGTITLDNIPYAKGLGVHAPSEVRYNLGGMCTGNFIVDVGIDDVAGGQGSVVFQVFLDGAKAYDSGIVRGSDTRKSINLPVAGKNEMRLVVTDAGDGTLFDLADWAGGRVTGCPVPPSESPVGPALASPVGGGGCSIGGDGRFDPTLPGLLLVALGYLGWRRRSKRP
jgi:glucose/arabinose dehydrogenase